MSSTISSSALSSISLLHTKCADDWGHDFLLFGGLFAGLYVFGTMGYNFKVKEASGRELVRPLPP